MIMAIWLVQLNLRVQKFLYCGWIYAFGLGRTSLMFKVLVEVLQSFIYRWIHVKWISLLSVLIYVDNVRQDTTLLKEREWCSLQEYCYLFPVLKIAIFMFIAPFLRFLYKQRNNMISFLFFMFIGTTIVI